MEKKYSISEALKFVLLPDGNTSDMEDESEDENEHLFEKSDDDNDMQNVLPKKIGCLELEIEADANGHFEESFQIAASTSKHDSSYASTASCTIAPSNGGSLNKDDEASQAKKTSMKKASNYNWKREILDPPNVEFTGRFSEPPEEIPTPYEYFKQFIDDTCLENIAIQTNMYALQSSGKELNVTKAEIEQFIGILLFTGIYKCPSFRMYWENVSRFPLIADVMSRNRFESLLQYVHFNDNCKMKKKDHPEYDPLFKVRPLLESLKANMRQVEPEECHAIDEQMIPFKGRSSLKQYNKSKPNKWGFKVFTRAGVSGLIYDFEIYTGKHMKLSGDFGVSGNSVLRMVDCLPDDKGFKVYFDNWFSSVPLLEELKKKKLWSVATIRSNRMSGCNLLDDKVLKEKGRGSVDFKSDALSGVTIVKWYDNKAVHMVSSYSGVEPMGTCRRWSKADSRYIDVDRPDVVAKYNKHMGGVDLADMLAELYRINVRSRKWYSRIVHYCFDTAVINAWLLYRRHMEQHGKNKYLPLKDFRCMIAHALTKAGKCEGKKRGRPSLDAVPLAPKRKKPDVRPIDDIRFDNVAHWPAHSEKRQRCKLCSTGFTRTVCTKCNVGLCFTKTNNCFIRFHNK